MSEQFVVLLEPADTPEDEQEDDQRCVTVEPNGRDELCLQILGPDQSATEFLNRAQFEQLVNLARRAMGWEQ
jgi:hypothetical protein